MNIINYAYSPIEYEIKQRINNPKKPKYIFKGKRILKNEKL